MAQTVSSHQVAAFATPINGGALDASVVRGNDNTLRSGYVSHDADAGIHLQSSALASRPAAAEAGRKWLTADSGSYRLFFDDGANWQELSYLSSAGGAVSGVVSFADGAVGAPSITNTGDTNTGFFFPAADTIAAAIGGAEGWRLSATGDFGVGGTPVYRLDVLGAAGTEDVARIGQTGVSNGYVITSDGSALTHTWATGGSALLTLTGSAFTLDVPLVANGNVTLGNASGDTLTVAPNAVTWSNNPTHSGNHTFSGNVTVGGTFTLDPSGSASSIESTTTQNVNTATTIFARGGAPFGIAIVSGFSGSDRFTDIVTCATTTAVAISSTTVTGSPAVRTYSMSSSNLQLAMASGTYSVVVRGFAVG